MTAGTVHPSGNQHPPWPGPIQDDVDEVGDPAAVRALAPEHLHALAEQLRAHLVDTVPPIGGQLDRMLGLVELTIAVRRVFDSPADTIVFDARHHSYTYRLLSERQAPGPVEYFADDTHTSTALGYAAGLAKAHHLRGHTDRAVVAVIADRALAGGVGWEGLNNLADQPGQPVIVVLADSGQAHRAEPGGLATHLRTLQASAIIGPDCHTCGSGSLGGNLFTHLGMGYLGPVDGHDEAACERALRHARALRRPVVVHCVTRQGHGYRPAQRDLLGHLRRTARIEPAGQANQPHRQTWSDELADELARVCADRDDVVAVTASPDGHGLLAAFSDRFPDRVYNVGDAAQHAVCAAAGLALGGLHPVVALPAASADRAFDHVLADAASRRLPVTFALYSAGHAEPAGPDRHGSSDLPVLPPAPGIRVASPRDPSSLRALFGEAIGYGGGPTVLRYPQARTGLGADIVGAASVGGTGMERVDVLHRGSGGGVLLVSVGPLAGACLTAAHVLERHGVGATVIDPRWAIPVNRHLASLASGYDLVVTVEEACRGGGTGALLAQACADAGVRTPVRNLGSPAAFVERAARDVPYGQGLRHDAELPADRIAAAALGFLDVLERP